MGSILHIHEVPVNGGGDTMFANMYAAHDALSETMKGLPVWAHGNPRKPQIGEPSVSRQERRSAFPRGRASGDPHAPGDRA